MASCRWFITAVTVVTVVLTGLLMQHSSQTTSTVSGKPSASDPVVLKATTVCPTSEPKIIYVEREVQPSAHDGNPRPVDTDQGSGAATTTATSAAPRGKTVVVRHPCIAQWQQSGVTKQLRGTMETFVLAVTMKLPWVPTAMANDHTAPCDIPFESLFNLTSLRNKYPGMIQNTFDEERHYAIVPCYTEDCFVGTIENQETWRQVLLHLDVADYLRAKADELKPKAPYVCLHARVERDFEQFFQGHPRYKRLDDIVGMIARYNFPSHIRTMYIAGGSTNGIRDRLRNDAKHRFDTFVSHEDMGPHRHLKHIEESLIDLAVCQDADIHIGTAGSIWSEWVHDYRWVRQKLSLMYAGDRQVTDLEKFVGANDQRFFSNGYHGPIEIVDVWVGNYGHEVRDQRITLAVEHARRDDGIRISPDFLGFFGFDAMPGAKKKCVVTIRVRDKTYQLVADEGRGGEWKLPQ